MKIERVGVMSPGDMGQAVAVQLKAKGFNVCTALERRSERTRALAREAGLTDVGTVTRLVDECDVVLSIMDPGAAVGFARVAADALRATGRHTLIVDCNAIAPDTVHEIAHLIEEAGGRFLDAGIIGPPPRGKATTHLFASGPGAADLEQLAGPQLIVHVIGDGIADASALKMCYGALTKGTQALWLEVLIAAQRLGVAGHSNSSYSSPRLSVMVGCSTNFRSYRPRPIAGCRKCSKSPRPWHDRHDPEDV